MATVRCTKTPNCVRIPNHGGVCTACPSAATLDWDHDREVMQEEHVADAAMLLMLDFPTPYWADLNDE